MTSATGNGIFVVTQFIPAVNPIPGPHRSVMAELPPFLQTYMTGEPKALGAVQIMIWVIHVILGGILCSLQYLPMSVFSGVVFWGAVSFFISGGLSVAAAARKNGSTCLLLQLLRLELYQSPAMSYSLNNHCALAERNFGCTSDPLDIGVLCLNFHLCFWM
ncbi:membrane-spanning 4-domains subfamily A member 15-like [Pleurodeles waltl]|uniref:membrane-spanning 4-domains subfamily A member 15-like n=1 Tax=Pleurodeles waltl TaxID=8319 RepID=UPI0037099475